MLFERRYIKEIMPSLNLVRDVIAVICSGDRSSHTPRSPPDVAIDFCMVPRDRKTKGDD